MCLNRVKRAARKHKRKQEKQYNQGVKWRTHYGVKGEEGRESKKGGGERGGGREEVEKRNVGEEGEEHEEKKKGKPSRLSPLKEFGRQRGARSHQINVTRLLIYFPVNPFSFLPLACIQSGSYRQLAY